ncbi:membrane lipoprotein lipid attachment site-containing protein (plasmid) [Metaplanococcus flavidus]
MKKIILLFIMSLVLSGCNSEDSGESYEFSGNSEHWEVIYTVEVSKDNDKVKKGTVEYIGEGEAPESIDYKLEMNTSGTSGTNARLIDGVANMGTSSCGGGCDPVQGDQEVEVEITWDGQTENLILTTDK